MSGNAMERGAWGQGSLRSAWWRARFGAERIRRFLEHRRPGVDPLFNSIYECGIMLVLVVIFDWFTVLLYCFSSTPYDSVFLLRVVCAFLYSDMRFRKFVSPNPRAAFLAFEASVVLSGRAVSENSRSSYSWRVFELGRVISLMTARPLDYHSRLIWCRLCEY